MKRFVSFSLLLMLVVGVHAQQSDEKTTAGLKHQLEVGAFGGVSSFVGNPAQGYFSPSYNAGLGFYYVMRGTKSHVGLRTGLAAESSQDIYRAVGYADKFSSTDINGDPIDVDYTIGRIREKHTQVYFTIPLQFSAFGKNLNFHIGPKLAISLADFTSQDLKNTTMSCTYPLSGVSYSDNAMLAMGTNDLQQLYIKYDKILPIVWLMGSAELSYDIPFSDRYALNIGVYGDYAINAFSVERNTKQSLMWLEANEAGTALVRYSGAALRSNYNNQALIDKFGYFTAGLKIALKILDN